MAKLGYTRDKWLTARLLDPTCGSGSFLLEAIEQKRRAALMAGWTAEQTVDMLTTTVWGFDLNPLAVQSSRVNFLIAIADLLQQCKGKDVEIPVLLADAVYSPAPHPDGDQKVLSTASAVSKQICKLFYLLTWRVIACCSTKYSSSWEKRLKTTLNSRSSLRRW
jgi:hypothetical protein